MSGIWDTPFCLVVECCGFPGYFGMHSPIWWIWFTGLACCYSRPLVRAWGRSMAQRRGPTALVCRVWWTVAHGRPPGIWPPPSSTGANGATAAAGPVNWRCIRTGMGSATGWGRWMGCSTIRTTGSTTCWILMTTTNSQGGLAATVTHLRGQRPALWFGDHAPTPAPAGASPGPWAG